MVRAPFTTRKCDHAHSAANTNSEVRKNFLKRSGGLRLRSGYALPEPEAAAAPSVAVGTPVTRRPPHRSPQAR